ncbi:putative alpha-mannosidase [Helianthus anomalus]
MLLAAKPLAKRVASRLHDGGKKVVMFFYGKESFYVLFRLLQGFIVAFEVNRFNSYDSIGTGDDFVAKDNLTKMNYVFCSKPRQVNLFSSTLNVGFDSLFFGRIDYQDKAKRKGDKTLEVIWRASKRLGSSSHVRFNFRYYYH